MGVGEREVGWVEWHRLTTLVVGFPVREREVLVLCQSFGDGFQRVARCAFQFVECILQEHIGVERIVFRRNALPAIGVVEWEVHLPLHREELAQFEVGGDAPLVLVLVASLRYALFQSTETSCFYMSCDVHATQVGQLHIHVALCCPSSFVVVALHTQFVHPHFYRTRASSVVSHTNHHGLDFAQRWITHHANLVVRSVFIVNGEKFCIAGFTAVTGFVALMLGIGEELEVDVNHVFFRPNCHTTLRGVGVVSAFWCEFQWHFVFVVVALVVATQADECTHLVVLQALVVFEGVGMNEHLQVLVLAEVEVHGLIHAASIARRKVFDDDGECLLVFLSDLRLIWVGDTADARRQHVVHRSLVVVLLDVHSGSAYRSRHAWLLTSEEWLRVVAPFSTHEVEAGETQYDRLFEVGQIHTHEADAGEVVDASFLLLILVNRDAELVPCSFFRRVVAQFYIGLSGIHNEVMAHDEVFRTNRYLVAEIVLIFVHRVVLVHVLHIGCGLVGCRIAFATVAGVRRVAFHTVDALVAFQDAGFLLVIVRATEEVVVVACRVVVEGVVNIGIHLALDGSQIVGVDAIVAFVGIC